ncbi:hypothetical protein [Delftia sp. GW456-R20]|uniref:hypothetical protein n=1 Tax=Delftia sp. GW456-R20 TaxID=1827145 RepID=UPI0012E72194|nr:hypothetical protein [Delftia sp. GW456-R20]
MGRYLNGINYDQPLPPPLVYVVTRDRLLSGKGILKVRTNGWIQAENMPMGITGATKQNPSTYEIYALFDCFISRHAAIACAAARIEHEISEERYKFQAIENRLRATLATVIKEVADDKV